MTQPNAMLVEETKAILAEELPSICLKALDRLAEKTDNPLDNLAISIARDYMAKKSTTNANVSLVVGQIGQLMDPDGDPEAPLAALKELKLTAKQLTQLTDARQSAEAEALRSNRQFCRALGKSLGKFGAIAGRSFGLIARAGLLAL